MIERDHKLDNIGNDAQRVTAIVKLRNDLHMVDTKLDISIDPENIEEVLSHGMELGELIGFSANCCARAEQILKHRELSVIMEHQALYSKPTILAKLVSATCYEEIALSVWADRLNSSIRHKMDFYRTAISKYKTELETRLRESNTRQN